MKILLSKKHAFREVLSFSKKFILKKSVGKSINRSAKNVNYVKIR